MCHLYFTNIIYCSLHNISSASLQVEIIPTGGDTVAGEQYTLTCTVTISPDLSGTLTVGWTGDEGKDGVTEGTPMTSGRVTTLTLTFNSLQDSQDGTYTCMAVFSCRDVTDQTAKQELDVIGKYFLTILGSLCFKAAYILSFSP